MNKEGFKEKIKNLLSGIDKDYTQQDDGWWDTTAGAEFGKDILDRIVYIIDEYDIDSENLDIGCDICSNRTSVNKMPCSDCYNYSWFKRY